ncbi:hypothetical protein EOI71_19040 [Salmonella enterica]|nr:hypothetical protein [Salmonella enterica]
MRRGKYCRFAYFPAVVHFRKVVIWKKVGSGRKDGAVIRLRFYKLGCNCIQLKFQNEKDK